MGELRATRRIVIDLEVDSEPISGRLRSGTRRARAFAGWTELASLLEAEHRGGHDGPAAARVVPARAQRSG